MAGRFLSFLQIYPAIARGAREKRERERSLPLAWDGTATIKALGTAQQLRTSKNLYHNPHKHRLCEKPSCLFKWSIEASLNALRVQQLQLESPGAPWLVKHAQQPKSSSRCVSSSCAMYLLAMQFLLDVIIAAKAYCQTHLGTCLKECQLSLCKTSHEEVKEETTSNSEKAVPRTITS